MPGVRTDSIENPRLERSRGASRTGRERKERSVLGDRELTDSERLDAFRMSFFQSQLPDLPPIPGYHVCWLTTNNRNDPLHGRLRLGYQLIKADEIPGWETVTAKDKEFAGHIMVNEMIASKIPMRLYQAFMAEAHHKRPIEEASRVRDNAIQTGEELRSVGTHAMVGGGTMALGSNDPGIPDFGRLQGETSRPYRPFERKRMLGAFTGEDEFEETGE